MEREASDSARAGTKGLEGEGSEQGGIDAAAEGHDDAGVAGEQLEEH